jgi:hypothetical protein
MQIAQIAGALLILVGFVSAQAGWLSPKTYAYLVSNLIGSALLTVVAVLTADWGFVLLEGVWAIVSALSLAARATGPDAPAAP